MAIFVDLLLTDNTSINTRVSIITWTSEETLYLLFNTSRQAFIAPRGITFLWF
jgi:hypothetical protein